MTEARSKNRFSRLAAVRRAFVDYATPKGIEARHQAELGRVYSTLLTKLRETNPQRFDGIASSEDQLRWDYLTTDHRQVTITTYVPKANQLPEFPSQINIHSSYGRDGFRLELNRDSAGKYTIFELDHDFETKGKLTKRTRRRTTNLLKNQISQDQRILV